MNGAPRLRQFAALLGLAACALLGLAAWRGAADDSPPPAALTQDGLTELRSRNGILAVTLRAASMRVRLGPLDLDGAAYNGLYAGPVLRLHPGDLLRVRLVNDLAQPTNLHFHGIRTSPLGNSDNAHVAVPAGGRFTYEIRIPASQPPGLYWYHSHLHGVSEVQVMHGLSGALVVEPAAPPAAGQHERLLVLKDMVFDDDTGDATIDTTLHGIVQSINGRLQTEAAMRPGETQLWRLSNQSADRAFHIVVAGHRLRIIAEDGDPSRVARDVDVLDLMPGSRADVLVTGEAGGRYALISRGTMTGSGTARSPDRVLGTLVVGGAPAIATPAASVATASADLRGTSIAARRLISFSQTGALDADQQRFFINGRTFDPSRVDIRARLGTVEEWTIRNDSDDLHVFHIHQVGFQVVAINEAPVGLTGLVDTVRVPERGSVTLRMAFTDPIILGRFMFHCHVLKHEDKGMMAQIEVYAAPPRGLPDRARLLALHVWWWWHGIPWSLCGLAAA
jgi:FtsP/CotA-like multicopper oxidase with cupredoxin domain